MIENWSPKYFNEHGCYDFYGRYNCFSYYFHSGETSFCWAFGISSMLRYSLNRYLKLCNGELSSKRERFAKQKATYENEWQKWVLFRNKTLFRLDNKLKKIDKALTYLNGSEFHKRLRNFVNLTVSFVQS